jgi:hypothetical protein
MAASAARSRHRPAKKKDLSWQTVAHSTLRPLRCSMNSEGRIHDLQTTAYHGIVTDTVEIDPAVAEAATKYFGFTPTGEAMAGDADQYGAGSSVNPSNGRY